MKQRTKFMKINNKILGKKDELLKQRQYENIAKKIENSRTYQQYMNNKETPLFTYITNDPNQFENWSAIQIFEWWRDLRMSGIPKREWPVFDTVKYLFINQFMRIMNSYLKYGINKKDKLAFDELQEYLRLVDVFYESGGQYQHLLNAHLAFCEWFSARFIGGLLFESGRNNDKRYVSSSILFPSFNNSIILTQSIYTLTCACIIFFMFKSFSLNGISQISIEINGLITTVLLNNTQLVILEINSFSKQVRIIHLNKDVINQKIASSFYYNITVVGWSIVDSQQNTQKQINMYKKQIGNLYTEMLKLQQSQPN